MDPREIYDQWSYARGFHGLVLYTDEKGNLSKKDLNTFATQAEFRVVFVNYILPDHKYVLGMLYPSEEEGMKRQLLGNLEVLCKQYTGGVITLSSLMFRPTYRIFKALTAM